MNFDLPPENNEGQGKRTPEDLVSLMHEPENVAGGWDLLLSEFKKHSETWTEEQRKKGFEALHMRMKDILDPWLPKFSRGISELSSIFDEFIFENRKIIEKSLLLQKQIQEIVEDKKVINDALSDYKKLEDKIRKIDFGDFNPDEAESDVRNLFTLGNSIGFNRDSMIEKIKNKMQNLVILLSIVKKTKDTTPLKDQTQETRKDLKGNTNDSLSKTNRREVIVGESLPNHKDTSLQPVDIENFQEKKYGLDKKEVAIETLFEDLEKVEDIESAFNIFRKAHFRLEKEGGFFSENRTKLRALKRAAIARMRQVSHVPSEDLSDLESGRRVSGMHLKYKQYFDLAKELGIPFRWF